MGPIHPSVENPGKNTVNFTVEKTLTILYFFPIFICSGFEIEPYLLTELLGEISSETVLYGLNSQAASVMSNRPGQPSPPIGDELAKPIDNLQVISVLSVFMIVVSCFYALYCFVCYFNLINNIL